jgi:hypothetical protein
MRLGVRDADDMTFNIGYKQENGKYMWMPKSHNCHRENWYGKNRLRCRRFWNALVHDLYTVGQNKYSSPFTFSHTRGRAPRTDMSKQLVRMRDVG